MNKRDDYLNRELQKKFNRTFNIDCLNCAVAALYDDGYVSDEELHDAQQSLKAKEKKKSHRDRY